MCPERKSTAQRQKTCSWKCWARHILAGLFVLLVLDVGWFMLTPDVTMLAKENPATTAFMEYRRAQWNEAGRKPKLKWEWVRLADISKNLVMAVTIGEDDKFWNHAGFDLEGMRVAIKRTLEDGVVAGGSTISQQLVKNLYFSPSKNPVRKFNEAMVTWRLERALSKKRIMELYLNCIEWGDGIFGIGAAARHYFGKAPSQLTSHESALLSAALPNPIRWSPTGDSRTVAYRSKLILRRMNRRIKVQEEYQRRQEEQKQENAAQSEASLP